MTWVFDHSPYKLGARLVHLAIADIVNEDNDWLLWAAQTKLADKALVSQPTVSSTIRRMCDEGYLELVEYRPGAASIYRFLRPGVSDSDRSSPMQPPKTTHRTPKENRGVPPNSTHPVLLLTQEEQKSTELAPKAAQRGTSDPIVSRAHALAVLAYEQPTKPVTRGGFNAVLKRIEAELRAGTVVGHIQAAIEEGDVTWTADGLRTAIGRAKGRSGSKGGFIMSKVKERYAAH